MEASPREVAAGSETWGRGGVTGGHSVAAMRYDYCSELDILHFEETNRGVLQAVVMNFE